jgi:hypothetical protein
LKIKNDLKLPLNFDLTSQDMEEDSEEWMSMTTEDLDQLLGEWKLPFHGKDDLSVEKWMHQMNEFLQRPSEVEGIELPPSNIQEGEEELSETSSFDPDRYFDELCQEDEYHEGIIIIYSSTKNIYIYIYNSFSFIELYSDLSDMEEELSQYSHIDRPNSSLTNEELDKSSHVLTNLLQSITSQDKPSGPTLTLFKSLHLNNETQSRDSQNP